jgi:PIN domain nuclease of toxin-antitoxin system
MFNTTLHFPSFALLWEFKVKLQSRKLSLCTRLNVLTAMMPEEEIQLACIHYKAAIVQKNKVDRVRSIYHP